MILAIDIGNTTIGFGLFDGGRLKLRTSLPTHPLRTVAELARALSNLSQRHRLPVAGVEQTTICSVVPPISSALPHALASLGIHRIRLVGEDLHVPLTNRYRYPKQVGQDRLVGAYAAWRAYRRACVVVDFGTAITIDVVTKAGEYLGGVIAPGLDISLEALASRTALLPRVSLRRPPELLGRDTASSIRSGLLYGTAALCDGIAGALKRRYAPGAILVATGGSSNILSSYLRKRYEIKPHLVLDGLYLLSLSA